MGITGKIDVREVQKLRLKAPKNRSLLKASLIQIDNYLPPNVHPDGVHLYLHFVKYNVQVSPQFCESLEQALEINRHCQRAFDLQHTSSQEQIERWHQERKQMIIAAYDGNLKLDASVVNAEIKRMREQRQQEIVLLGEDNNLRQLYNTMSHLIDTHGEDLCNRLNGVLVYEIDLGKTSIGAQNAILNGGQLTNEQLYKDYGQKRVIVLDFSHKYLMGAKHGHIYLENYLTLNHDKRVGDAIMKMSLNTFDQLSAKKMSGFRAVITGKLTITGSLSLIQKFDSLVVGKYCNDGQNL